MVVVFKHFDPYILDFCYKLQWFLFQNFLKHEH